MRSRPLTRFGEEMLRVVRAAGEATLGVVIRGRRPPCSVLWSDGYDDQLDTSKNTRIIGTGQKVTTVSRDAADCRRVYDAYCTAEPR